MFSSLIALPLILAAVPSARLEPVAAPPQAAARQESEPTSVLEKIRRQKQQRHRSITDSREFFSNRPDQDRPASGGQNEGVQSGRPFRMEMVDEAQRGEWFRQADANENEWLSFRESEQSLKFDRPRFRIYDANHDGRLVREEFETYYADSVRRNAFTAPARRPRPQSAPRRSPQQIRNAYDHDLDTKLSANEVTAVLADYNRTALPLDRVMAALDENGDSLLTVAELDGLPSLLFPVALPPAQTNATDEERPATVLELFGQAQPRGGVGGSPSPPYIAGPVPHFRRLDLDDDGAISVRDLESLLRPLHINVRLPTLVNTLDTNLDGVLSEAEFMAALGSSKPPVD